MVRSIKNKKNPLYIYWTPYTSLIICTSLIKLFSFPSHSIHFSRRISSVEPSIITFLTFPNFSKPFFRKIIKIQINLLFLDLPILDWQRIIWAVDLLIVNNVFCVRRPGAIIFQIGSWFFPSLDSLRRHSFSLSSFQTRKDFSFAHSVESISITSFSLLKRITLITKVRIRTGPRSRFSVFFRARQSGIRGILITHGFFGFPNFLIFSPENPVLVMLEKFGPGSGNYFIEIKKTNFSKKKRWKCSRILIKDSFWSNFFIK